MSLSLNPAVFAHVDCANFFVSCERVFRPDLDTLPVAVLSNNDGCIIARSNEVKALGISMGAPYFQVRERLTATGVQVFSSNYALYADLSHRVHDALGDFSDAVERYSIDEAFLGMPLGSDEDLVALGSEIVQALWRWLGLPVRVGFGVTKTLAKLASEDAKSLARRGDVPACSFVQNRTARQRLAVLPPSAVWGIGKRTAAKLAGHGITTIADLIRQPDAWVRRVLTVRGLRTVWELRGRSCLPLTLAPPPRKTLMRSRSFGSPVTDRRSLGEALTLHASRAGRQLRSGGQEAAVLHAFVTTKRHARSRHYHGGHTVRLAEPTNDSRALVEAAKVALGHIYRSGITYRKAGVMLLELAPAGSAPRSLFETEDPRRAALMHAVDQINARYGAGTIRLAGAGSRGAAWRRREAQRSPCYTTDWNDLCLVKP